MKVRMIFLLTVGLLVCGLIIQPAQAIDKTSTGFYYPLGRCPATNSWLAGWPTHVWYQSGKFHIGTDDRINQNSPVYAVADGEMVHISHNYWNNGSIGGNNKGIAIRHKAYDGSQIRWFYAIYGHIIPSVSNGQTVTAGQQIGVIGDFEPDHLHFGIIGFEHGYPRRGWGKASWPADVRAWWAMKPSDRPSSFRDPTDPEKNYFVDPIAFIESHTPYNWLGDDGDDGDDDGDDDDDGTITPPPSTSQASLATLDKTDQGEGYWLIVPTCEDSSGQAGGVRSIHLWLHMRTHTPEVWIDLGKQFSPGNPSRWSTEFIYDIFTHFEEGVYEIYVETEGGNGQLLMQYGGKNIDVNRSTQPPIKINSSARQVSASQVDVMLHGQAQQGRRFMASYEAYLIAGDRSILVTSANVSRNTDPVNLSFNPQSFGLYPGDYQLAYRLVDVWSMATGIVGLPHWINASVEMNWYYAVDLNGNLAVRRQMPDGSWMGWASVDGSLANIDVARAGDYQVIVGSDPNGGIWTRRADGRGLSGWLHHDGTAIYGPSVVEHNGAVYLLVVGTDHALYIRYTHDGLTWSSGWYVVSDGRLYQSVVGASFEGNIHLFGVDAVGNCYRTIWDTVNQPHWTKFDGTVNYALSVTRLGSQLLVLAAAGDSLYTRMYQNGWFTSNWQNLDGAARADPDMSTYGGQATIGLVGMGLPLYFRTLSTGWQGWGGTYRDMALCDGRAW